MVRGHSLLNIVFTGNFLYPQGMAGTKRVQHFIDAVCDIPDSSASVLLFRQGHAGRDDSRLTGKHNGVPYRTIGADIARNWQLPWTLLKYVFGGIYFLVSRRRRAARNVLFLYGEPNIENVLFVLFARMIGYRILVDVVEDFYLVPEGAPFISRLKGWSTGFAAQRIGWFADGMVVISSYLYSKFESILGGRVPICLIPVSVDTSRILLSASVYHDPIRIVYAGSFGEKDGVENLIAAFDRVAQSRPGIELLLTGKAMDDRIDKITRQIDRSAVRDQIHYRGFLSDSEYYSTISESDVLCVVRIRSEFADRGFPFKLGEFLATGRPVIASAIGDIPEYLTDRRDAVLVEPGSVSSIVDGIEYLISDPRQGLLIGKQGRKVAEREFDTRAHARKFLELINSLWG